MANTTAISPLTGTNGDDTLNGTSSGEVISGYAGDDTILANSGNDHVYAGSGDDYVTGNSGADVLYGDRQIKFADLTQIVITDDHPVTVTFEGEGAGYRNSFGWYKVNTTTGQIYDVQFIWENASSQGSGGNLINGVTQESLDVSSGDQIGFFIVANGYGINNSFFTNWDGTGYFEMRNADGTVASIYSTNPSLYHVAPDGTETEIRNHDYHTAAYGDTLALNPDGILHTVGRLDVDQGTLTLGFEDLYNGGDRDFDDTVFTVDIGQANAAILNAHSQYGSDGYEVNNGVVSRISDAASDLTYSAGSLSDAWDIRHVGVTNNTQSLSFRMTAYGGGISVNAGMSGQAVFLLDLAGVSSLPNIVNGSADLSGGWSHALVVDLTSGGLISTLYSVESGALVGDGTDTGLATLRDGELYLSVSLSEFGLSVGDDFTWGATLVSENTLGESSSDRFDKVGNYTIASFNDQIYGGNGADTIYGEKGHDILYGGDGSDVLKGGSGNDTLYGDSAQDTLHGGSGNDSLFGGSNHDILNGNSGDDNLYGGSGDDILNGNSGNDHLDGGSGHDTLHGGSGNDTFVGGTGNDSINGGSGTDTIDYSSAGKKVIASLHTKSSKGDGNDTLLSIENLIGTAFNDKLSGSHIDNTVSGGDGDDRVYGRTGDDYLYGDAGNDYINGGSGDDFIFGGTDDDSLNGYRGADTLTGGSGADIFIYRSYLEFGDTIMGFETEVEGEYLDISDLLDDLGAGPDPLGAYFQVVDDGAGSCVVQIDTSGLGTNWTVDLVTLDGIDLASLDTINDIYVG
ncbi:DUF4114 domain-containing protein [Kiloniella sp. EL199]|uniref:calcium-binding protein n=1 Tax=Kiloniella sp. EL199 TaxID=2107581 RepID=UPI000EA3537E|nr:DUF4114 domain-containing protein [Kiloniella sp. EL199]